MPNLGSFGQGMGGDPQQALQMAIAARQQGGQPVSQLSQVSGASPQGQTPQPAPVGANPPVGTPQVQAPQSPPKSEAEQLGQALAKRLAAISKVEESMLGPQMQ